VALIGAPDDIKKRLFSNMSKRASELLQEDIAKLESMNVKHLIIEMNRTHINETFYELFGM